MLMKNPFFLVLGLMIASLVSAGTLYRYNEATKLYDYVGTPVESLDVNFATIDPFSLPTTWTAGDSIFEFQQVGFYKFIKGNRPFNVGSFNCAFNNNTGNEDGKTNATTATPPVIWLPTTKDGVKTLTIVGGCNNARGLFVNYKDGDGAWKSTSVTFSGKVDGKWKHDTLTVELNTTASTSIYIMYKSTDYMGITRISLEMDNVAPSTNLYQYNETTKAYDYIGNPVDEFGVDFSTWTSDLLPATWTDDAVAYEAGQMALVKWKIATRGELDNVNALHNTGTTNDATPIKNNASTNKPRIYLPTTSKGVKSITAVLAIGTTSARSIAVYYKDGNHAEWTHPSGQDLSTFSGVKYGKDTVTLELNTVGETSIYLQYASTEYAYIPSISLTMVQDQNVAISRKAMNISKNESSTLTAVATPETLPILWTSSNESVATVTDGIVTGVSNGKAYIYASTGIAGVKDSCEVTVWAYEEYEYSASDSLFHYVGEDYDAVYVDFTQDLTSSDLIYSSGTDFANALLEVQSLGIYKWGYYASRQDGNKDTYAPVLWNNGGSEDGRNGDIRSTRPDKLPCIYCPSVKNGIKQIIIDGWTNNQSRNLIIDAEDANGKWKTINVLDPTCEVYYAVMPKTHVSDTIHVNNCNIKKVRFWTNANDYKFLTKVEIVPMETPGPATDLMEMQNNMVARKHLENGHLVIVRNGSKYNALGAEL